MGNIFSNPEAVVSVVTAVSGGISAIIGAFNANRTEVPVPGEDNELRQQIIRLNSEIAELTKRANADQIAFEEVRQFVNAQNFKIGLHKKKVAVIGPKGAGKSTFLWLCNVGPKPKNVVGDGTVEVELMENSHYVDTIGVDFNFHMMMKMIAVFIALDHVPDTIVVCCNAHQVNQAAAVFAMMGVTRFYLACVNPEVALKDKRDPRAFNTECYAAVSEKYPGILPVSQVTRIERVDSFHDMWKIFPSYKVKLESYSDYRSNQGVQEIVRYWICKYLYEVHNKYDMDYCAFLNAVTI